MTVNKKKPSKGLVIVYAVVLLLLIAGLVALLAFVNVDEYTLNVRYIDGNAFCKDDTVYFSPGQEARFAVEYFDKNGEPIDEEFSVKIVPVKSEEAEIMYKVGNSISTSFFTDLGDLSSYFTLTKTEDGFSIIAPEDFSVENAIKHCHPVEAITFLNDVDPSALHFRAVIASFDGNQVIEIYFDRLFSVEIIEAVPKVVFGGV